MARLKLIVGIPISASSSGLRLFPGFCKLEPGLFKVGAGLAGAMFESRREPPGFCRLIEVPVFCNPEEGVTTPLASISRAGFETPVAELASTAEPGRAERLKVMVLVSSSEAPGIVSLFLRTAAFFRYWLRKLPAFKASSGIEKLL